MIRTVRSSCVVLLVLLTIGVTGATAANYPLEITNVRPGLSPGHRLSRAFPGLDYNVRAAVVGGVYPYVYSLADAPDGMTIDPHSGVIRWADPRTDVNPTLIVQDAAGTRVTAAWAIRVTEQGFRFIDAAHGRNATGNGCSAGCGDGTRTNPWRTIGDMFHAGRSGEMVYFRSGVYGVGDLPQRGVGTGWDRVEFLERRNPVVWMSEPGHSPIIDFGYKDGVAAGSIIRFTGANVYVEGFETINSRIIGFQFVSAPGTGPTFRRLRMHAHGPGLEGSNAAFIMTTTDSRLSDGMVIQECEFWDVKTSVTIKIYAQRKLLIEDTVHHHTSTAIELKHDIRQFTVRGNTFHDIDGTAIGGNMHETTTHGEILFNHVRAGTALDLNQDGMAGPIYVSRNTFVGRVQVRNTDAPDGPFTLADNVIVSSDRGNGGARVHFESVTAPERVVLSNNLAVSPGDKAIDSEGGLSQKYARYRGSLGHQR